MKYVYWMRIRSGRLLVIFLALLLYGLLLILDASQVFSTTPFAISSLVQFGFSAFIAVMFLAVGALVWLYARNRQVALVLFGFCVTMMLTFTVQTGALAHDRVLAAI